MTDKEMVKLHNILGILLAENQTQFIFTITKFLNPGGNLAGP